MKWLIEHWELILIVITIAAKVLDSITKHFSEHKGLVKWCLWIINVLNVFKTTPAPKKDRSKSVNIASTSFLLVFFVGCSPSTFNEGIVYSYKGLKILSQVHEEIMRPRCRKLAQDCRVKKPEDCFAWVKCRDLRRKINAGLTMANTGLKQAHAGYEAFAEED